MSPGGYQMNDSGNADRLVEAHGDLLCWVEDREVMMAFDGQRWKADRLLIESWMEELMKDAFADARDINDTSERRLFLQFLNNSLQRHGITNAIHSARRKLSRMRMADFDADPYFLNFANGTVDLRTGQLREHSKTDHISKMVPYGYDPAADAPCWTEFLKRTQGGGSNATDAANQRAALMVEYIQRAVGCSATGISGKHLFVCVGPRDTGKTTFQEVVRKVLGPNEYSGLIQIDTLMMRGDTDLTAKADIADLQGLRFVSTSEVERGRRLAVARVKQLTGGGAVKACRKHENPFSFQPTHTIWMDTNEKPVISDPHDAIWGRLRALHFGIQIPKSEQKATFIEELLHETKGIAAWIVQGAVNYLIQGLNEPPEVLDATEEYRQESDRLRMFLADRCDVDTQRLREYWVIKSVLWDAYTAWVEEAGEQPLKKSEFESQIQKLGCQNKHDPSGAKRAWRGIRLRTS